MTIHFVDLSKKLMAPGEIRRFIDRFGLRELVDREGKSYVNAGLGYFKLSDSELIAKIKRGSEAPPVTARTEREIGSVSAGMSMAGKKC